MLPALALLMISAGAASPDADLADATAPHRVKLSDAASATHPTSDGPVHLVGESAHPRRLLQSGGGIASATWENGDKWADATWTGSSPAQADKIVIESNAPARLEIDSDVWTTARRLEIKSAAQILSLIHI